MKPTIVFVPFFGGKKENLKRHLQFVEELGYPTAVAELTPFRFLNVLTRPPMDRLGQFGIKFKWTDEVEKTLNTVQGPKIIYSFSSPTACAIGAIARRGANDILKLVGDCGPFVHLWDCFGNYIREESGISPLLAQMANTAFQPIWSLKHDRTLHADLRSFPDRFPVLSIRCAKDHLVPEYAIEEAFIGHSQLKLQVLRLNHANHLAGIKEEPEIYKQHVADFLNQ